MTAPDRSRIDIEAVEAQMLHYVRLGRSDGPALCGITGNWDPDAGAGPASFGPQPVCPLCALVFSRMQR